MPAIATDRLQGLTTSVAVKPPCVAVTSYDIPLSGLVIGGPTAIEEGDRVLVFAQTDATENGIYNASTSDWTRALDFDGARDVVPGTLVIVENPSIQGAIYEVVATAPIVIGTTAIFFRLRADPSIIYDQTADEIAAGVVPVNTHYPPLHVDRYGSNVASGTTSMAAAFQAAINVARKGGGTITFGPGPYLIDAALDLTFPAGSQYCSFSIIGQGRFKAATNTVSPILPATPSIILKHTGNAFDTTGSLGVHFENLSICTDEVTYPKTCFLLARNSDGGSRSDRIINCYVLGRFSKTVLYNYGCEDGTYIGNQFFNISADSDTSVFDISGYNIRGLSSAFTTIATGSQSCLDHKIFSGEYANLFQGSGVTADVFRFDGARSIKIYGPWLDSSAKSGASAGRSLIYIDGTNAALAFLLLSGVDGEAALHAANYGILVSNHARTHSNITIENSILPNSGATIGGGTGAVINSLKWSNSTNSSQGGNISFDGSLVGLQVDSTSGTVAAASIDNFANAFNGSALFQANGQVGVNLRDFSQPSGSQWIKLRYSGGHIILSRCDDVGMVIGTALDISANGFGFNGTAAVVKPTVTGSRGANAALASLLAALASMGLLTDSST